MTDKGYTVGGKYRSREVEGEGTANGPTHPFRPTPEVLPINPEHVNETAVLRANRIDLLYDVEGWLNKSNRLPPVCAELGVYEGIFSGSILHVLHPKELHLFDLNTDPLIKEIRTNSAVVVKEGDSSTNLSVYPDDYFDFIYVDGDHSYEGARKDLQIAKTKLKAQGFLQCNDYTLWSFYEMVEYGVVQAVNELVVQDGFKIYGFGFMSQGGYHDILLRKV